MSLAPNTVRSVFSYFHSFLFAQSRGTVCGAARVLNRFTNVHSNLSKDVEFFCFAPAQVLCGSICVTAGNMCTPVYHPIFRPCRLSVDAGIVDCNLELLGTCVVPSYHPRFSASHRTLAGGTQHAWWQYILVAQCY